MNNNVSIANFNVTFGKNDAPMLEYFESVVLPAFTSDLKRKYKVPGDEAIDYYYFLNVRVVGNEDDFYLVGHFVKETVLQVKSRVEKNQLIKTNESYPSAPYSAFYIRLNNHRMVLIKNQKGSPELGSFAATTRNILDQYIRAINKDLKKNNKELLPLPIINVIGISMREGLEEVLKEVTKINKLTLKFYPLNGDLDLTPVTKAITETLRIPSGSNTGNINLNSCDNKKGVIDIIEGLQGVMEPSLNVNFEHSKGVNIRNNTLSEKTTWNLDEDSINDPNKILPKFNENKSLKIISDENSKIYSKFKKIINKYL